MSLRLAEGVTRIDTKRGEQLRVAVVTASLGLAGAEKQAFYMAKSLAEAGVDVRVYCLARGGEYAEALREMGVESTWFGRLPGALLRLTLLIRAMRGFRPDVIQSVHAYTNVYSAIASKLVGAISVGGLRSDLRSCFADNGRIARSLLTWPDVIAVNSMSAVEQLRQKRLLDATRVHFLPNAIDVEAYPERRESRKCSAICVSRLFPAKRVDMFVRALAAARSIEPELQGVIVGYGPEEGRLRALAGELGLKEGALRFLGFRDDIAALLHQASMFVFCSESEGTPNVVLEAMAAGLPVITTPAGDTAEIVNPAHAGYVIPFGDADAVADRMVRLAQSPALRKKLGVAGRNYVARNHASSDLAGRLMKIYAGAARTSGRRDNLLERMPNV
jgi:glycosyltransferase involved in cell wall biosynthesis